MSDKKKVSKNPMFNIGDIVKHRIYPFRGVIVDVDPEFSNTEEWYQSIPADLRPSKKQPFYHLMAENSETFYYKILLWIVIMVQLIILILNKCLVGSKKVNIY